MNPGDGGSVEDHGESAIVGETPAPVAPQQVPLTPAAQRELREDVDRSLIGKFVLGVLAAGCLGGIVALIVLGIGQYQQIVDVVSYGVAPFAGIAGGMAGYYFASVRKALDRRWLTRFALIAIVVEVVVALIVLGVLGGDSFGTVKDVLSYGLTPLALIAGAIATYYFAK
jgi:hypothetical protein